ncbi:glycosyltransferase [Fusobacterium sp. MFO224]|uniref:glycosyltransferase n=1 Tax=Fusobacterium sp. MFO224 TaxID=3378070 RepID=UPI0038520CF9
MERSKKRDSTKSILLIIDSLEKGGAQKNFLNLANYLYIKDYNIKILVTSSNLEVGYPELLNSKIEIDFLNIKKQLNLFLKLRKISEYKCETVICFSPIISCYLNFYNIFKRKKIKIISRCMNTLSESKKIRKNKIKEYVKELIYKNLYFLSNKIIAQSIDMQKDLIENYNISSDKIKVINNSLSKDYINNFFREKISLEEKKYFKNKTIAIVGRLVKQKNHVFLIYLIKKIVERGNKINLVILGKGPEEKNIRDVIKKMGLENYVFLLGAKSNPYKYIKESNFLWLSSYYEGFPNVLLDAIFSGTVIISNDCKSGPREIISQGEQAYNDFKCFGKFKYGYLYKLDDHKKITEEYLQELEKILFNSEIENSNIEKNYKEIEKKYYIENQLSKYLEIL